MILGVGVDICSVPRLKKWAENPEMLERFFNPKEMNQCKSIQSACEHYAARFAAKEAFSKALGTGLLGFDLKDVYITNDESGKPFINVENKAAELLNNMCGKCKVHVSLSHEKESAIAFVIIEN